MITKISLNSLRAFLVFYVTFILSIIRPSLEILTSLSSEKSWRIGLEDLVKIRAMLSKGMVERRSTVKRPLRYILPVRFESKTSSPVSIS